MRHGVRNIILASVLSAGVTYSADVKVWVVQIPQVVEQTVQPLYPAQAWSDKLVGNGAVDIGVDVYGFPASVKLVSWDTIGRQSDSSGLEAATLAAIKQWRFKPLRVSERFVSYEVRIGFLVRPDGITYTASKPEPATHLDK